jgi:hypothetical protein
MKRLYYYSANPISSQLLVVFILSAQGERKLFVCLLILLSTLYVKNIQGDSGGICTTLGNNSMSDFKKKSSYEHGSDFERLRSYGNFLFPVHALM